MIIVGLTGGISTGKSTISNKVKAKGIPVIDADRIARQIMEPGEKGYNNVLQAFGREVLLPDNINVDRKKLGEIIFNNEDKRLLLNKCTHPVVRRKLFKQVLSFYIRGYPMVVLDIPLLFEGGLNRYCSKTIVVSCNEGTQLQRLMLRDGIDHDQAIARIESQMPISAKVKLADFVIDNNGSVENSVSQLDKIICKISPSKFKVYGALLAPIGILASTIALFIPSRFNLAISSLIGSATLLAISLQ
ncbi:hypothetical protein BB560_007064 [Smittium megazygosporum]|uniref:Dephospho-CoA kinase n=1 Tax=Smittium megazygosporum TaxID=133381 RepID=A0A2T9XZ37_9FUNG|nr:hypothetical protein BB560_007064 [Smittium megazygosporum]